MSVTGYKFPATTVSETISGGNSTDWVNINNIQADDTSYATWDVTTASSDVGPYAKATNFGFTTSDIPSGSTIDGIEVEYGRFEGGSTDNVSTNRCRVVKAGAIHTANVSTMNTTEWATSIEAITEGGATNKWGLTWVDTDIVSNTGFGIAISPLGGGTTPSCSLDYIKVRVYYTESSGRTTSLAATEENDTLAASAAVKLTASLNATESEDTLSASAKVAIAASLSATEADDTLSASASAKHVATLAATEDDDTLSAAAKVAIASSLASTEEDDSLAASSKVAVASSLNASEEEDTLSASATVESNEVNSTLAVTEEEDALTASAAVRITASLNAAETDDTLSANAAVKVTASLSATEDEDSLSASSAVRVAASLNTTEDDDTLAASGTVTITSSLNATEEDDSLAANAEVLVTGSLEATEDDDTLEAEASGEVIALKHYTHRRYPLKVVYGKESYLVYSEQEQEALLKRLWKVEVIKRPKKRKKLRAYVEETNEPVSISYTFTAPDYSVLSDIQAEQSRLEARRAQDLDDEEALTLILMAI